MDNGEEIVFAEGATAVIDDGKLVFKFLEPRDIGSLKVLVDEDLPLTITGNDQVVDNNIV